MIGKQHNFQSHPTFKRAILIIFIFSSNTLCAQQDKINSLKKQIANTGNDTAKIILYEHLGEAYREIKRIDSAILSYQRAVEINEKYNYSFQQQCWDISAIDWDLYVTGNYVKSLEYANKASVLSIKLKDTLRQVATNLVFGHNYRELGDYQNSLKYFFKARGILKEYDKSRSPVENPYTIQCIGEVYLKKNRLD